MKNLKKFNIVFCLGLILITFNSCKDKNSEIESNLLGDNYLIFGTYYGECQGESCIETFALTNTRLYEDTNDNYGGTDFNFDIELSSDKFVLVTGLEDAFPEELLDETEDIIGCPDCGDWGGIYVELVKNGVSKRWRIDVMLDDVPTYLHDFIGEIQEKIELINE